MISIKLGINLFFSNSFRNNILIVIIAMVVVVKEVVSS